MMHRWEYGLGWAMRPDMEIVRELRRRFNAIPNESQRLDFELDRSQLLRSYDQRIGLVDHAIGAIRRELSALGEWDDTLLIVTSDHGAFAIRIASSSVSYGITESTGPKISSCTIGASGFTSTNSVDQSVVSNARRAAPIARSMSSRVPSAASPITSSVAGFTFGY